MNPIVHGLETTFEGIPLPLLEVWGRFGYYVGFAIMLVAFGGFTFRVGSGWGFGRERQAWDTKAFLSIPLTFLLIIATGYVGSFIVLVPGAQTFESLKDLTVFLCVVLFGYPALITVPFAYGLSDLIEGTPPSFLLDWLPGYFINPACFWLAYQFFGRQPDFRKVRTWGAYVVFVAIFLAIEPVLWGYICAGKFTPAISYRTITPALVFTTSVTWLLAPFAMLVAWPLARRFGMFWAEIPGHVRVRLLRQREWAWMSGTTDTQFGPGLAGPGIPIRMLILAPFVAFVLVMVGATAYVTLRSAADDADRLAVRLHQEIAENINLRLDDQLAGGEADARSLASFLRGLPIAANGRAFIVDHTGRLVAASVEANDPIITDAIQAFHPSASPHREGESQSFRFERVTAKPLARDTWLARATNYRDRSGGHDDWIIVTAMPESYYLAGVRSGNSRSAVVFALALLLSLAIAAVLASLVTAPVRRLSGAIHALARGDLAQELSRTSLEELAVLTDAFNHMAGQLRQTFDAHRSEVEMRSRAETQVRALNRTYAMLSEINQLIVRKCGQQEIFDRACQIAVDRGGLRLAWIGLVQPTTGRLGLVAHGGASPETIKVVERLFNDPARGCGFTAQALRTGVFSVCSDIEQDPRSAAWRELAIDRGYLSLVSLPLIEAGKAVGTFNLYAAERGFFDAEELQVLNELATNISFAREVALRESEHFLAEARTSRQRDALIEYTGRKKADDDDLPGTLRRLAESSALTLSCARVSVWRLSDDHGTLECHDQFVLPSGRHSAGERLAAKDFPVYFRALADGEVWAVEDSATDERTREFQQSYFRPNNIGALLDVPIYLGGRVVGVLCHEHVGGPRAWTADEKTFVLAMANLVSLGIERWERRQAEAALRTSEERFRELAATVDEVFWINDPASGELLYVSPAYERIWGRSCESLRQSPRSWFDAVHHEDRGRMQRVAFELGGAAAFDEEFRICRPDESVRWIRARIFPVRDQAGGVIRTIGVAWDITERHTLQEQFLRAQRMEAIGTLASGLAHDLNNILAPVLMASSLLRKKLTDSRDQNILTMIEGGAKRGAGIIRQLLTFGRGVEGQRAALELRYLVKDLGQIVGETFPRNIVFTMSAPASGLPVLGDSTQLHQMLLNLCVNARDAMPQGGELTLTLENVEVTAEAAQGQPNAKPGPHVRLRVTDTGEGIPRHIMDRIFDPFFTTKPIGKGTGLGLSSVMGIVKSHGGFIKVTSEPGKGTTFEVCLPAVEQPGTATIDDASSSWPRGQNQTVLIVDDEAAMREATRQMLELHGYRAATAANGEEAIKLFVEQRGAVQLVLTDMDMPVMGGSELIRALRLVEKDIRVVVLTGSMQVEKEAELASLGVETILAKPCPPAQLLQAFQKALG